MSGKIFKKWIDSILWVSLITYFLGYLGKYHWLLDAFSHFRIYHLFFFLLVVVYGVLKKRTVLLSIFSLFVIIILIEVFPFYVPNAKVNNQKTLKIGSINLLSSNSEYQKFLNFIEKEDFDVFLVMEITPGWEENIQSLKKKYPFNKVISRDDNFGIGVFSRIPFSRIENIDLNEIGLPSIEAQFEYDGEKITLIGTHPLPPAGTFRFKSRNNQFEKINSLVKRRENYVIVMGDFNCTTYSKNMGRVFRNTQLTDTRKGFGVQNSWNANLPVFSIPIDHCFVTKDFLVNNRKIGENIGSDHLPVIVELIIKGK